MNRKLFGIGLLALALAACSGRATPQPTPAATATQVIVPTPAPVTVVVPQTVVVPVTVVVPQTVVVTATPAPIQPTETAPAPTDTPAVAPTPTPAAASAATPAEAQATGAPLLAALPPVNTTPIALNGPDPLAGATGKLFEEYFSPPDFWGIGADADSTVTAGNGQLTLVNHTLHSLAWTLNGIKGKDFYAQVYLAPKLCGFGDNYGIAFRAKDNQNLDLFGISCDGRYRLLQIVQGQSTPVIDWTETRYIRKYETTNVIGVRAAGDQVALYVNNYYLATATAGTNLEGRFGLYVGNIKTADLTVNFSAFTAVRVSP